MLREIWQSALGLTIKVRCVVLFKKGWLGNDDIVVGVKLLGSRGASKLIMLIRFWNTAVAALFTTNSFASCM